MLVALEVQCVEKNPEMFSSKNLMTFPLKKEKHEHLGWQLSKLSGHFHFEVN